ncbi:hypothetical protein B5S33_g690 [[Candida] boidinii]|nr:hypothetical protein B5S30_g83 [[Candida] boidinii]OWB82069.1 hypothetical protein B5S33_g690 [[Candida] boidinii]GMF97692.1 unnamed protein product [[Candida] boidinii]
MFISNNRLIKTPNRNGHQRGSSSLLGDGTGNGQNRKNFEFTPILGNGDGSKRTSIILDKQGASTSHAQTDEYSKINGSPIPVLSKRNNENDLVGSSFERSFDTILEMDEPQQPNHNNINRNDNFHNNIDSYARNNRVFTGADILPDYLTDTNEDDDRDTIQNKMSYNSNGVDKFLSDKNQQQNIKHNHSNLKINNSNKYDLFQQHSNPLRQQTDRVKDLENENLNLKVELLTLKKVFDGQPRDKIEAINRNIELQKENIRLTSVIKELNKKVNELKQLNKENNANSDTERSFLSESSLTSPAANNDSKNQEIIEDLNNQIEGLNVKIEEMNVKLNENSDELYELRNERDSLDGENEDLNNKIKELHSQIEDLKDENKDNDNKLDFIEELESKVSDLEQRNEIFMNDNQNLLNKVNKLENELDILNDEKDNLIAKIQSKDTKIESLERENEKLFNHSIENSNHNSNDEHSNNSINDINDNRELLLDLKNEVDDLKYELRLKEKEMDDKNNEISNLRLELNDIKNSDNVDNDEILNLNSKLNSIKLNSSNSNKLLKDEISKLYENQKKLTNKNLNLIEEKNNLVLQLKDIKDSISHTNNSNSSEDKTNNFDHESSYVRDIEADRSELYDKVIELSKIIEKRDKEIKSLNRDIDLLNFDKEDLQNRIDSGEVEISKANKANLHNMDLMKSEMELNLKKINNELELIKNEKSQLMNKIEELKINNDQLINQLANFEIQNNELINELKDKTNNQLLEDDFKILGTKYNQLQNQFEISNNENQIKINLLSSQLESKEIEILKLNEKLNILKNNENKISNNNLENEFKFKLEVMAEKSELENKLKLSEFEIKHLQNEIQFWKEKSNSNSNKINENSNRNNNESNNSSSYQKTEVKLLESRLEEMKFMKDDIAKTLLKKKQEIVKLNIELDENENEKLKLLKSFNSLEVEQNKILRENEKLTSELNLLHDTIRSKDSTNSKDIIIENYKAKLSAKQKELEILIEDYNKMKNDLLDRFEHTRNDKKLLAEDIEYLKSKLEKARIREEIRESLISKDTKKSVNTSNDSQSIQYPLTPTTPRTNRRSFDNQANIHDNENYEISERLKNLEIHNKLYENVMSLYKSKLDSTILKHNDLKFMNDYLQKQIQISNDFIKNNITKLESVGLIDNSTNTSNIFSDNTTDRKGVIFSSGGIRRPISFRSVALAILAGVRMRKRLIESQNRKHQDDYLKKQIRNTKALIKQS